MEKCRKDCLKIQLNKQVEIENQVKAYLAEYGISSLLTNYYILFAKNMLKKRTDEADIEFNKWAGRNLSWYHLRNIGRMFFHRRLNLWNKDNQPETVLYFPFSQGAGDTAFDKSGNGNDGSLNPVSGSVTDETFTSDHDVAVQLDHTNLVNPSVVVTSKPAGITYTEGVDYTIGYNAGTITVLSTGGMADATDFLIDYDYSDSYPTWGTGLLGNGLYFDGIDDYVRVADMPINSHNVQTITTWIRSTDNGAQQTAVSWSVGGFNRCNFSVLDDRRIQIELTGGTSSGRIRSVPTIDEGWNFIVVEWNELDPDGARAIGDGDIYINGALVAKTFQATGAASTGNKRWFSDRFKK